MDRFALVEDNEDRLIGKITMLILSIVMIIVVGLCIDDIVALVAWSDALFVFVVTAIFSVIGFLTVIAFLQTDIEFFIFLVLEVRMMPYVMRSNEIIMRAIANLGLDPTITLVSSTLAIMLIISFILSRRTIIVD